jgi:hypothetical protein
METLMTTDKKIQSELKDRIRNRRDGFEPAQERVLAEIRAERRREQFTLLSIPRPVRAAAALAAVGLGSLLIWNALHSEYKRPLCPHSAKVAPTEVPTDYIATEDNDIFHPERYNRICYCAPRYSGSLR